MDVSILVEQRKNHCLVLFVDFFSIMVIVDIASGLGLYLITWNMRADFVAPTIGIRTFGLCLEGRERYR